jgi:Tetratricopeptide Repeats-Sensor
MHAFIVRPFGTKNGIDFDHVERELIRPAMEQAGFTGGTTVEFIQQGNIRTDMFEQLLIADLVIADVSIHNANAFYELGIRHAFRDKRTFLIKSEGDDVPFDLKTDRYLPYDATHPAVSIDALSKAFKATWDSQKQDSPVFQLLPGLEPADPTKFLVVPLDFREEVQRAEFHKKCGELQLLSAEVDGFAWKAAGLRLIGNAQFKLKDWHGARATWVAIREYDDMDLEANTLLGTVYQRLDDLVASDQALERALKSRIVVRPDLAEIRALMARNAKTRWERDWNKIEGIDAVQRAALASPHLECSFDLYHQGFIEDRNHFYSGLNALSMVTIMTELAGVQPQVWEEGFDSEAEAAQKLKALKDLRSDLAVGVRLAIDSKRAAPEQQGKKDVWAEISVADLTLLSSSSPSRVGRAYKSALAEAPDFACDASRAQILRYQPLGILIDNAKAALDNIPGTAQESEAREAPPHVLLFTGHRIDAEGRANPRFPRAKENQARAMIAEAVTKEKERSAGGLLGISGGASGGDILFHEVCEELGISTRMYLVIPKSEYIKASVADAGPEWVNRFNRLTNQLQPEILSESGELPRWLRAKKDYSIWQRSNLWMLHDALDISKDNLTLIALWNGATGDGPGGTEDMVKRAQDRGATFIHLDARKLLE